MEAYNFYLSTFRYIINAKPEDKSTWCDIFKYLPCLRQMLSCSVCGNIPLVPHAPTHGVCPHTVCQKCLGGRMRLKPSCSWCKDHSTFKENKKLRILIHCFKRLCGYVSHSNLGAEISKVSVNGFGNEAERTIKVLEEAEQFRDDYVFTPAPAEFPTVSKLSPKGLKSLAFRRPLPSTGSGIKMQNTMQSCKRKRGRPKRVPKLTMKPANKNIAQHVKRLKKIALSSAVKSIMKRSQVKTLPHQNRPEKKKKSLPDTSGLLISQRPHREKSGKYSIGQLWRETFLEEAQPEPYPDSGIEVGNSPDHDLFPQNSHSANPESEKSEPVVNKQEVTRKETRFHKHSEIRSKGSSNDVTSSSDEVQKPRLTLTISKRRYQSFSRRSRNIPPASSNRFRDATVALTKTPTVSMPNSAASSRLKKSSPAITLRSSRQNTDICKCARFKQPNHLTCFGQKCPCYSDRRACVDCFCNGCKNPLKPSDSAPSLTHIKETDGADRATDRSMPRLSPVPQM